MLGQPCGPRLVIPEGDCRELGARRRLRIRRLVSRSATRHRYRLPGTRLSPLLGGEPAPVLPDHEHGGRVELAIAKKKIAVVRPRARILSTRTVEHLLIGP